MFVLKESRQYKFQLHTSKCLFILAFGWIYITIAAVKPKTCTVFTLLGHVCYLGKDSKSNESLEKMSK